MVLEKTLESPFVCKEIQRVSPKAIQPGIFIGRINAEAEAPILRPPDSKSQRADSLEKTLMMGRLEGKRGSG